jgi:hypothetical protein
MMGLHGPIEESSTKKGDVYEAILIWCDSIWFAGSGIRFYDDINRAIFEVHYGSC